MIPKEVFLSHSTTNRRTASKIAETLRNHRVPVWYSTTNIMSGDIWHDEIGKALRRCDWFMLLLSEASVKSIWVKKEYMYVLRHRIFDDQTTPVTIGKCNIEDLSWTIEDLQIVDWKRDKVEGYRQILRKWGIGLDPSKIA